MKSLKQTIFLSSLATVFLLDSSAVSAHKLSQTQGLTSAHRLSSSSQVRSHLQVHSAARYRPPQSRKLFNDSGFVTKVDLGDTDSAVLGREKWSEEDPNKKLSGWVNPLSVVDDGTDDD